jgi:hypothetical protein
MIKYAVVIAAVVGICSAMPAGAEEVGVGVGPVGVTVGQDHGDRDGDRDRDRDRDVIRDRDHQDHDKTVITKGDHDRDVDHDRRPAVIDRQ